MNIVIGITGNIGVGKTTVSDYLKEKYDFNEYTFAKPLKEIAKIMGFKNHEVYGTQEEKLQINEHWGISGRTFIQKFGTDICRELLPKAIPEMSLGRYGSPWVKLFDIYMSEQIDKNNHSPVVIGDVRFKNEASIIREHNGYIIRIVNQEHKKSESKDKENIIHHHASETEMSNIKADVTIVNDGSVFQLYQKIDMVIKNIIQST